MERRPFANLRQEAILSLDKKSLAKHLCNMDRELVAYICRKSTPVPECDCWIWTGARTRRGYGHGSVRGRQEGAHRISWMAYNGRPIEAGLSVLHKCDVPECVNPDHLFLGTAMDNSRDMILKGRGKKPMRDKAMSTHIQKMVLAVEADLRGEGIPIADLTTEAGIAPSTWSRWKSGDNSPTLKVWTQALDAKARLMKRRKND